jgi:serine/threonine-protein kinase
MGSVYEAEHLLIHRRVALKLLHAHVLENQGALHRFEREAQAAGRIGSPHIVEVLDMGELVAEGGQAARFLVMELLEGETLLQRVRSRGRLTPEEAAQLACQILAGLGAAHATDIVHRDLKPANIFLVRGRGGGDFVKILDFGVSKFNAMTDDMAQTAPGAALGTPFYMSPEQAKGSPRIDARSDLYAVGVILYECVSGQVPFDAGTFNELIFRIVLESPPPLESFRPDLDRGFVGIVHKAMAREPDERWRDAHEMHDALAQWLAETSGRPFSPGVLPWGQAEPFVPRGAPLPQLGGAHGSTALFEAAPTLLREPPAPRRRGPLLLGAAAVLLLAGAGLFFAMRRAPSLPPALPAASAAAPASAAPVPRPSAPPAVASSAPAPLAPPSVKPPVAARTAPAPVAPSPVTPAPGSRTVPSDL